MTLPRFDFWKRQQLKGYPATIATSATRDGRIGNNLGNVADVAIVAGCISKFSFFGPPAPSNVAHVAIVAGELSENSGLSGTVVECAAIIAEGCNISQEEATQRATRGYGLIEEKAKGEKGMGNG